MSEKTRQGICWICKLQGTLVMRRSWIGTKHWICKDRSHRAGSSF